MLNHQDLTRAPQSPRILWELMLERKRTLNENQNQRQLRKYFRANTEQEARAEAVRQYPEFIVASARRAP